MSLGSRKGAQCTRNQGNLTCDFEHSQPQAQGALWCPVSFILGPGASADGPVRAGNERGWVGGLAFQNPHASKDGGRLFLAARPPVWACCLSSFPGDAQPITWLGAQSRLLTSADTGRGNRSQPDTSWQPHLHES